jgi:cell division protein ZapA
MLPSPVSMPSSPVELRVGGQTYRVVASADESELQRLAALVDERLRALTAPGRAVSPQSMVLAAISLAHDLEEERRRRQRTEQRHREMLTSILARIDAAFDAEPATHASGVDTDDSDELEPSPAQP